MKNLLRLIFTAFLSILLLPFSAAAQSGAGSQNNQSPVRPAQTFVDIGGFDNEFRQAPNDPKRIIRIEIAQFKNKQAAYKAGDNINEEYYAIQSNKSGTAWRLITKGNFSSNANAQPHIDMLRNEKNFPSARIVSYSSTVDDQIIEMVNRDVAIYNKQLAERNAQDRRLFGLVDDFKTGLIDQSSAPRRLASCIGIMRGAQYAASSLSQQNLALSLAQQMTAFSAYGSSKFPSFNTMDRLMLDGAERDAQSGAEVLSRNNQQALVFRIANNCKGALGAALKN